MAYDVELADRLREFLADEDGVVEKRMFGSLAFLIGGHLSVTASGQGGLMLRVPAEQNDILLEDPGTTPVVMRGREMPGWLLVAVDATTPDEELGRWVELGVAYARSLPPKD